MNNRNLAKSTTEEVSQSFKSAAPYIIGGYVSGEVLVHALFGHIKLAVEYDGWKGGIRQTFFSSAKSSAKGSALLFGIYGVTRGCLLINEELNELNAPSPNVTPAPTPTKR